MKNINKTRLAILALSSLAATTFAQQPAFSIEDLGAANGESEAFAINNSNQVVGWSFLANGARGAMLWSHGNMQVINNTSSNSAAYAINDDGVIVGRRGTRPVHFTGFNTIRDLGTFNGPGGVAYGINDYGQVAGTAQRADGIWRAFSIRYDRIQNPLDLGTLGGNTSVARDVNNGRQLRRILEWNLDHAWGLNDGSVIVGRGFNYSTGSYRAFMATRTR